MKNRNNALILGIICLLASMVAPAQAQTGPEAKDLQEIYANIRAFSQAYMDGDYEAMAQAYTEDGRILPPGPKIIQGREDIHARWIMPEGYTIVKHLVSPEEIEVTGNYAYDVGYYEGITRNPEGEESAWKGKYLIVWKKEEGVWKIHIDAWNRVND